MAQEVLELVLPCSRVFVLTYKNHALDEFLKRCVKRHSRDVLRVGGRGDKELDMHNLRVKKRSLFTRECSDDAAQNNEQVNKNDLQALRSRWNFVRDMITGSKLKVEKALFKFAAALWLSPRRFFSQLTDSQIRTFLAERFSWELVDDTMAMVRVEHDSSLAAVLQSEECPVEGSGLEAFLGMLHEAAEDWAQPCNAIARHILEGIERPTRADIGAIEQAGEWTTVKRRCRRAGCGRELSCVDREINNEVCEVNVPGWEKVQWQMDSGAVDTVVPRETARAFAVRPTEMSKRGIGFIAANGSKISNYGEKKVIGWTDEGMCMGMRMTCADVKKPLCSVYRMNMGGNVVVFDGDCSYMQNKLSGRKTRIRCEDGQYVFNLWVQASETASDEGQRGCKRPEVSTSNRFHALSSDNEERERREAVFMRRALSQ